MNVRGREPRAEMVGRGTVSQLSAHRRPEGISLSQALQSHDVDRPQRREVQPARTDVAPRRDTSPARIDHTSRPQVNPVTRQEPRHDSRPLDDHPITARREVPSSTPPPRRAPVNRPALFVNHHPMPAMPKKPVVRPQTSPMLR